MKQCVVQSGSCLLTVVALLAAAELLRTGSHDSCSTSLAAAASSDAPQTARMCVRTVGGAASMVAAHGPARTNRTCTYTHLGVGPTHHNCCL